MKIFEANKVGIPPLMYTYYSFANKARYKIMIQETNTRLSLRSERCFYMKEPEEVPSVVMYLNQLFTTFLYLFLFPPPLTSFYSFPQNDNVSVYSAPIYIS